MKDADPDGAHTSEPSDRAQARAFGESSAHRRSDMHSKSGVRSASQFRRDFAHALQVSADRDRRMAFLDHFLSRMWPNTGMERWKFSDFARHMAGELPIPLIAGRERNVTVRRSEPGALDPRFGWRVVTSDGNVTRAKGMDDSPPDGLQVQAAEGNAWKAEDFGTFAEDPVLAYTLAGAPPPVRLGVTANATVPCVSLQDVTQDLPGCAAVNAQEVTLAPGARMTLIEQIENSAHRAARFGASRVMVGPGAHLEHVRIVRSLENQRRRVDTLLVDVDRGGTYRGQYIQVGGDRFSRVQAAIRLVGQDACAHVGSMVLALENTASHIDHTFDFRHAAPHTTSTCSARHILGAESHSVLQGRIHVDSHAQKTDAGLLAKALLLGETGMFSCKPELDIYADDVQCGHGATTGGVDPEALFYLRSRGMHEQDAVGLLVQAFLADVLDKVADDHCREWLRSCVATSIAQSGGKPTDDVQTTW